MTISCYEEINHFIEQLFSPKKEIFYDLGIKLHMIKYLSPLKDLPNLLPINGQQFIGS